MEKKKNNLNVIATTEKENKAKVERDSEVGA